MSKSSIKKMSTDELMTYISKLSDDLGETAPESFENVADARLHALGLEERLAERPMAENPAPTATEEAPGTKPDGDASKYDTSGKRGPNLGTGKYAKQRIQEGADNKTILAEIREKFPEAKTSMASIAYYRNRMKHDGDSLTPEALRAKADTMEAEASELRTQADELEAALAQKAQEANVEVATA